MSKSSHNDQTTRTIIALGRKFCVCCQMEKDLAHFTKHKRRCNNCQDRATNRTNTYERQAKRIDRLG